MNLQSHRDKAVATVAGVSLLTQFCLLTDRLIERREKRCQMAMEMTRTITIRITLLWFCQPRANIPRTAGGVYLLRCLQITHRQTREWGEPVTACLFTLYSCYTALYSHTPREGPQDPSEICIWIST